MSNIYFVHAATGGGVPVVKASRATIDEALSAAEFELSGEAVFAWIVDGEGRLTLPADQVKARLMQSAKAPRSFAG
jgi:hypothetical protein